MFVKCVGEWEGSQKKSTWHLRLLLNTTLQRNAGVLTTASDLLVSCWTRSQGRSRHDLWILLNEKQTLLKRHIWPVATVVPFGEVIKAVWTLDVGAGPKLSNSLESHASNLSTSLKHCIESMFFLTATQCNTCLFMRRNCQKRLKDLDQKSALAIMTYSHPIFDKSSCPYLWWTGSKLENHMLFTTVRWDIHNQEFVQS